MATAARMRRAASAAKPWRAPIVPLGLQDNTNANGTALNNAADPTSTGLYLVGNVARLFNKLHSESHDNGSSQYDLIGGKRRQGTSSTTLGQKMSAYGMRIDDYRQGSSVEQNHPKEAPDLEANYPLAIAWFWPGCANVLSGQSVAITQSTDLTGTSTSYNALTSPNCDFSTSSGLSWTTPAAPSGITAAYDTTHPPSTFVGDWTVTNSSTSGTATVDSGDPLTNGFPVCDGQTFTVTGQVAQNSGSAVTVKIGLRWKDANGDVYSAAVLSAGTSVASSTNAVTYTTVTGSIAVPAGARSASVRFQFPVAANQVTRIGGLVLAYPGVRESTVSSGINNSTTTLTVTPAYSMELLASLQTSAWSLPKVAASQAMASSGSIGSSGTVTLSGNGTTTVQIPPSGVMTVVNASHYCTFTYTGITYSGGAPGTGSLATLTGCVGTAADTSWSTTGGEYLLNAHWPWFNSTQGSLTNSSTSTDTQTYVGTCRIDSEILGITAVSATASLVTLTVVRGMWGTTAASHSTGALVFAPVQVGGAPTGVPGNFGQQTSGVALRYLLALDQNSTSSLWSTVTARATEWFAKRCVLMLEEADYASRTDGWTPPGGTTSPTSAPASWVGYAPPTTAPFGGQNSIHLDITSPSVFNTVSGDGQFITPWSFVNTTLTPNNMVAYSEQKLADLRSFINTYYTVGSQGISGTTLGITPNNAAYQNNTLDSACDTWLTWTTANGPTNPTLEFWLNDPSGSNAKYLDQLAQWFKVCINNWQCIAWVKVAGLPTSTFANTTNGKAQYRRWGLGHFLLAWRGSTKQMLMTEWTLGSSAPFIGDPTFGFPDQQFMNALGKPMATPGFSSSATPASLSDLNQISSTGVYQRNLTMGTVLVNTTGSNHTVHLPQAMRDCGQAGYPIVASGTAVTVNAYDAAYYFCPGGGAAFTS